MSWDWVGEYPIFVYTAWLDHNVFNVDIVIGIKGDQNAGDHGPTVTPDLSYTQAGLASKGAVVAEALIYIKPLLQVMP